MTPAVLETERLRLREMRPEDEDALAAVLGDPVAMRFYPEPFTRERVRAWIDWNRRLYRERGHGLYALVHGETGVVIGDCGLIPQTVDGREEIEIGYHVLRELWGRGFATEAARACRAYGFATLPVPRLISMIRPENGASRRVAEKNGMTLERTLPWKGYDHCIYQIERR